MKIIDFMNQPNVTVAVTSADLQEFAHTIVERTISEMSKTEKQENEQYLTTDEAAVVLSVSKNTLWRWNKTGYFCPIKVGRKSLYPLTMIKQLLNKNQY